jgi:hypothetical protein
LRHEAHASSAVPCTVACCEAKGASWGMLGSPPLGPAQSLRSCRTPPALPPPPGHSCGPVHPPRHVAHPFPSSTTPGHMYFVQGVTPQAGVALLGDPAPGSAPQPSRVTWCHPGGPTCECASAGLDRASWPRP